MSPKFIYLLLYVDDMLVTGPNLEKIKYVKCLLITKFDMKDLKRPNKVIGYEN